MSLDISHISQQLDDRLRSWRSEHLDLDAELTRFLQRMSAVSWPTEIQLLGIRSMLDRLVESLDRHFELEDQLLEGLVAARDGQTTPEIEAVRRQSARDSQAVRARIAAVRELLCSPVKARHTWTDIKAELNLIADLLEQHEEQERCSIAWLRPRDGGQSSFPL